MSKLFNYKNQLNKLLDEIINHPDNFKTNRELKHYFNNELIRLYYMGVKDRISQK